MRHRYRVNKIKRMHGIINGLLPVLEAIAQHPEVSAITPGRIKVIRHTSTRQITMQHFTDSGLRLLARNGSLIQEVFIVTGQPANVHSWLVEQKLIEESITAQSSQSRSHKSQSSVDKHAKRPAAAQKPRKKRLKLSNHNALGPIALDQPAAPLLSDHLENETRKHLEYLGRKLAAKEVAQKAAEAEAAKAASEARKAHGADTDGKASKGRNSGAVTAAANGQPTNALTEWLAQTDDATFSHLARKNKGK